jgi:hypothetical protein
MDRGHRRHGPVTDVGLPEVVGFALGAGAMATAIAALEANLSGSEAARRLVREGIAAELHRVAADLVPRVMAIENPLDAVRHRVPPPAIPVQRTGPGDADPGAKIVSGGDGNLESCRGRQGEN